MRLRPEAAGGKHRPEREGRPAEALDARGRGEGPGAIPDARGEAELQAVQVKLQFPGGVHRKEGASLDGVTTWSFFFFLRFILNGQKHLNSIYRESFQGRHNPLLAWIPHLRSLAKEGAKVSRGGNSIPAHLLGNSNQLGLRRTLGSRTLEQRGGVVPSRCI